MKHDNIKKLVPLYAIGRLDKGLKREVESHMNECKTCKSLYEREMKLRYLMLEVTENFSTPPPRGNVWHFKWVFSLAISLMFVIIAIGGSYLNRKYLMFKTPTPKVEVTGFEDVWDGYVLVEREGGFSVELYVDGDLITREEGKGYVFLEPDVSVGSHFVELRVIYEGDTFEVSKVVLHDPDLYSLVYYDTDHKTPR
ncbi:MAG: hypothetical protein GXO39_09745 [Thermotogae bacterium]|nr:hypothetical protein [Thermotogota bacterium]